MLVRVRAPEVYGSSGGLCGAGPALEQPVAAMVMARWRCSEHPGAACEWRVLSEGVGRYLGPTYPSRRPGVRHADGICRMLLRVWWPVA